MQNVQNANRKPFFDIFKAMLMFCVVAGHGIEVGITGGTMVSSATYMFFYLFHMPAFLFLLGFFSKSTAASPRKIISRFCFFFVLFALGKAIYYGGFQFIYGYFPEWMNENFFAEDSVPWYMLTAALYMIVLFPARKLPWQVMLPVSIVLSLVCGAIPGIGAMLCGSRTLVFLPFFLAGYYIPADFFDKLLACKRRPLFALSAIPLIAAWVCCWKYIFDDPSRYATVMPVLYGNNNFEMLGVTFGEGVKLRALFFVIAVFLTAMLALFAAAVTREDASPAVLQVGRNTLIPYLCHYPVFLFCNTISAGSASPATFLVMVCGILLVGSLDIFEDATRLIQKGFYALFRFLEPKKEENISE